MRSGNALGAHPAQIGAAAGAGDAATVRQGKARIMAAALQMPATPVPDIAGGGFQKMAGMRAAVQKHQPLAMMAHEQQPLARLTQWHRGPSPFLRAQPLKKIRRRLGQVGQIQRSGRLAVEPYAHWPSIALNGLTSTSANTPACI